MVTVASMGASESSEIDMADGAQARICITCDCCHDNNNEASSYCIECCKHMCENCRHVHDTLLKNHTIVSATEGFTIKHIKIKCDDHDKKFSYYCQSCQVNICKHCRYKSDTHSTHVLEKIDDHAKSLKDNLMSQLNSRGKILNGIESKTDKSNEDYLSNFMSDIDREIDLVKEHTKQIKKQLHKEEEKLIKILKQEKDSAKEICQKQRSSVGESKQYCDNLKELINKQLQIIPSAGVLHLVNEINTKLASKRLSFNFPTPSTFSQSNVGPNDIQFLGSLKNAGNQVVTVDIPGNQLPSIFSGILFNTNPVSSPPLRQDFSVLHRMTPHMGLPVHSLCTSYDGGCWVTVRSGSDIGIVLYLNRDYVVEETVNLQHRVDYTTLMTTGDLLVSGLYSKVIMRVQRNCPTSEFASLSAPDIDGVCGLVATSHDDILVGVCMTMDGRSRGARGTILKFSASGQLVLEIDTNNFHSNTLFGIHIFSPDIFCVQDAEGQDGRLVFLDMDGNFIRSMNRLGELQKDIKDMLWDNYGNLIAGTEYDEYIHVFDKEGACTHDYHLTESKRIYSLSLGEDSVMWIGTRSGEVVVVKYM